jgi:hypothetical protein
MMQLLAKRATSEPPQVSDQRPERRSIADPSRKATMLAMLQIEPTRDNCAGYLTFPSKFRLLVKGDDMVSGYFQYHNVYFGRPVPYERSNTNNENTWTKLTEENFRTGDNCVMCVISINMKSRPGELKCLLQNMVRLRSPFL